MANPTPTRDGDANADAAFALCFTPAEWRLVLEDDFFLSDEANRYSPPRRLMGVAVQIVPDHRFG